MTQLSGKGADVADVGLVATSAPRSLSSPEAQPQREWGHLSPNAALQAPTSKGQGPYLQRTAESGRHFPIFLPKSLYRKSLLLTDVSVWNLLNFYPLDTATELSLTPGGIGVFVTANWIGLFMFC